jgi:hypothetical protein
MIKYTDHKVILGIYNALETEIQNLKDIIKILHPELLPEYKPFFFEKLK